MNESEDVNMLSNYISKTAGKADKKKNEPLKSPSTITPSGIVLEAIR